MEGGQQTTLDLSKKGLKKVPKQDDAQNIKILILDDNELQKIDNIDSYLRIEKVNYFFLIIVVMAFCNCVFNHFC